MHHGRKARAALDRIIGQRIHAARRKARMSRQRLAAAVGVDCACILAYERGGKHVGARRLCLIARTLQCPVSCFFDADGSFSRRRTSTRDRDNSSKHVHMRSLALTRAYYRVSAYRLGTTIRSRI
jgi:transcriptional regulator with XRE-family HTH domain